MKSAPRLVASLASVLATVLLAGAGGWGLRTLVAPSSGEVRTVEWTTVTAGTGTVSRSMSSVASASWASAVPHPITAEGTVTQRRLKGVVELGAGAPVVDIDLRPVVVAEGSVPAFRDLARGARGQDVQQLQQLLPVRGLRPYERRTHAELIAALHDALSMHGESGMDGVPPPLR